MYSVLPASVANDLRHQRPVPANKFDCVTILFSGIVGFSEFCQNHSDAHGAMKIVKYLNDVYTKFDDLLKNNPNVYKVWKLINILLLESTNWLIVSFFNLQNLIKSTNDSF